MAKIVYDEKCTIEALSKEGRKFSREISLIAKETSRQSIDNKELFKVDYTFMNGKREEEDTILTSDLEIIRDYFLRKISAAIDLVHPERRVKIIFPPQNKYLKMRKAYCQGKEVSDYRAGKDRGSNQIPEPVLAAQNQKNGKKAVFKALEELEKEGDFQANSLAVLSQNR